MPQPDGMKPTHRLRVGLRPQAGPVASQMDLFEAAAQARLARGRLLRDEGMERVRANGEAWPEVARLLFCRWRDQNGPGHEFIAEDFRSWALANGLPRPHHANAWGAFFSGLSKSRLVRDTGRSRQMQDPRSHARRSPIYALP